MALRKLPTYQSLQNTLKSISKRSKTLPKSAGSGLGHVCSDLVNINVQFIVKVISHHIIKANNLQAMQYLYIIC